MNNLVSDFVHKLQTKNFENLRWRTQKLDPLDQETLLEYLEDNLPGNYLTGPDEDEEEDYELLQRDLDRAHIKLEELQSKRDFLQTRLSSYRSKIQSAEESIACGATTENDETSRRREKLEAYKRSLQPVEDIYQDIQEKLMALDIKIRSMQDRQLELKLKTQECRVVQEELSYNASYPTGTQIGEDSTDFLEDNLELVETTNTNSEPKDIETAAPAEPEGTNGIVPALDGTSVPIGNEGLEPES